MEGTCRMAHAGPCWTPLVPVTAVMADGGHRRAQTPATAARSSRSASAGFPSRAARGIVALGLLHQEPQPGQLKAAPVNSLSPEARGLRSSVSRAMLSGRVRGWRVCPQPLCPLLALPGAALALPSSGHFTPLPLSWDESPHGIAPPYKDTHPSGSSPP